MVGDCTQHHGRNLIMRALRQYSMKPQMFFESALCIKMCQSVPQDAKHVQEHLYIW